MSDNPYKDENIRGLILLGICAIFGISIGGAFFYFFRPFLWTWFNVLCSIVIALVFIFSFCSFLIKDLGKDRILAGFVSAVIGIIIISVMYKFFYVTEAEYAEKAARQQFIQQQKEEREQREKEAEERAKKREAEENEIFAKSNERFMAFGPAGNDAWALGTAENTIKRFSKNPKSVEDVKALSQTVRVRLKEYPQCRYAMSVEWLGQNSYGAMTRSKGVVLFDGKWNGITVLEKSPF